MPALISIALGVVLIVWRDAVARLIARGQLNYGARPSAQSARASRIVVSLVGAGFIAIGARGFLGFINAPAK